MRISHQELFEITAYAIGKDQMDFLKKHYQKYGDFSRVKQMIITAMIEEKAELLRLRTTVKRLQEKIDSISQLDAFRIQTASEKMEKSLPPKNSKETGKNPAKEPKILSNA